MGCVFISQGVLILYVSKSYNFSVANVGYLLFIPTFIQAIVTYFNGYFLEKTNLKYQINIGLGFETLSLIMIISGYYPLFILGLIFQGFGNGILISVPNYLIITLHKEDKFQKLNIINFFFSVGGIIGPFLLGQLLDINWPWQLAVSLGFIFLILLFWLNKVIEYSRFKDEDITQEDSSRRDSWHISIYLIAAALFFYVLSECIFSAWIVSYFKMICGFSIGKATLGLTIFWLFITFGRFASDKIARYMKLHQFILISSSLAFIAYLLIFINRNTTFDLVMIAIMGMGYAGLYASILSYGIDQLPYSCPKLMSFMILAGTIGGVLALPFSSFFVNHFSILSALMVGLIILALVIICIYVTLKDKNNKVKDIIGNKNVSYLVRYSRYFMRKYWRRLTDFN
ncbi:MAG: hypothetical protein A2X47_09790 [Lentisphaerae bacterium GWF2_38_69]|nr:MAG: hypothetical protein A2X47_09790 [Lentisphaerae bacterium GWF2_38_69]